IAAKAVGFLENLQPRFEQYGRQVIRNAQALSKKLMALGYYVISEGTDNHLMLVDLRSKNCTGKDAQEALAPAGITVNKNAVPFDDKCPLITSGIRIGTPALTTRGMKEPEMEIVGELIDRMIRRFGDAHAAAEVEADVRRLCAGFPLYHELLN